MAAGLQLYSLFLLLLVIDFPDQLETINCKSTNKDSVCNKWYQTYHNSLENLNQFIYKFTKTFYNVGLCYLQCNLYNDTNNRYIKSTKKINF